jgi:4-hydroxybenzoate polyprenyltransferase
MSWFIKALAWLLLGVLLVLLAIWSWSAGLNPYWPVIAVVIAGFSFFRSYKAFVEVWRSRLRRGSRSRCRPTMVPTYRAMPST